MEKWQEELLAKLGPEKISFSQIKRELYATAACIYDILPLAICIPENVTDLQIVLDVCRPAGIPVIPRGAASSLAGQVVGEAVILDLSKYFLFYALTGPDNVRAGVSWVMDKLDVQLASVNRRFAPDPSSGNVANLGGVIANNSGGPHSLSQGNSVHHLESVEVILADGKPFTARSICITEIPKLDERHRSYYKNVLSLIRKYSAEIKAETPKVSKHSTGYQVWQVLENDMLNMQRIFAGSEGTLGIIYEAELKLQERPIKRGVIPLHFNDLGSLGKAVPLILRSGSSAMEFVDESFIKFAKEFAPESSDYLPTNVRYLIWAEYEGDSDAAIELGFERCRQILPGLGAADTPAVTESDIKKITSVRRAALGILNRMTGAERPIPFIEDAVIPPEKLADILPALDVMMEKLRLRYVVWGHIGSGNLHIRPLIDLTRPDLESVVSEVMELFISLVLNSGGLLSGEHGDGRLRTPFIKAQFPLTYPLFKELKELFDPAYILNPDVKIPVKIDHWFKHNRYQRRMERYSVGESLDSKHWLNVTDSCHGCGTCREYCPVFQATGEEAATGRAKANLLRSIYNGRLSSEVLMDEEAFSIFEWCINCGQCLTDCPTAVDIPALALLAREKYRGKRGFSFGESILMNGKLMSEIAGFTAPFSNIALKNRMIRYGMETVTGIDHRRDFPPFSKTAYDSQTFSHKSIESKQQVVLWTGCHAQYSDPEGEAQHSVQILEKLGYQVILPEWRCCNIARLTHGDLSGSIDDLNQNMEILLPYAESKIPIIFTSASCGYAFRREYLKLFPDRKDIAQVAKYCDDIHNFLGKIFAHRAAELEFVPIKLEICYHEPCHLKSQQNKYGPLDLLNFIPDLKILPAEDSCCGIAGTFGMKQKYYDLSMDIGHPLFKSIKQADPQIILSGCGTCQMQIKQGTDIDVIHPVILLNRSLAHKKSEK